MAKEVHLWSLNILCPHHSSRIKEVWLASKGGRCRWKLVNFIEKKLYEYLYRCPFFYMSPSEKFMSIFKLYDWGELFLQHSYYVACFAKIMHVLFIVDKTNNKNHNKCTFAFLITLQILIFVTLQDLPLDSFLPTWKIGFDTYINVICVCM